MLPKGGIAPGKHPVFSMASSLVAKRMFFTPASFLRGGQRNRLLAERTAR